MEAIDVYQLQLAPATYYYYPVLSQVCNTVISFTVVMQIKLTQYVGPAILRGVRELSCLR